ncbi:hypothetical protein Tco_0733902 [Tanacetum coccineum]
MRICCYWFTEDEQAIKEILVRDEESSRREKDDGAQDVEVMEQHSLISRFSIIQSPEGEYIVVQRANGHIRAFNTLNEVLQFGQTRSEESDDELWRNQTEWEIISWRFYESTRVHLLELENGTMIHMLVEQRGCSECNKICDEAKGGLEEKKK